MGSSFLKSLMKMAKTLMVALLLFSVGCASGVPGSAPVAENAAVQTEQGEIPPTVREKLDKKLRKKLASAQRYDKPAEAMEFYAAQRAPAGQKRVPVERYLDAMSHARSMPRFSTRLSTSLPSRNAAPLLAEEQAEQLNWTELGPGNIGGRTRALLINPLTPRVMYAAGVAGGVWKSTDAGGSWRPLSDMLSNIAVNSMAMDPKNPRVIYAGTGEGYFNGDSVRGLGVFKTMDAGATWEHLQATNRPAFHYVNDIVVSPNDSRVLYAATRSGVWRSKNAGATWWRVLDPKVQFAGCLDLAIRSDRSTDHVLASCGSFGGDAVVFRNTEANGKGLWEPVLKKPFMGRTSLAIAPSDQNIMYAMATDDGWGDYSYGLLAVFRSTDGGQTWTAVNRSTDPRKLDTFLLSNPLYAAYDTCGLGGTPYYFNQGWYDNVLAVDPVNPSVVWAGGVDLFRSDDGGRSWGLASYWWADSLRDLGHSYPSYCHADQHVIVFDPRYNGTTNTTLFVGNDGGIFRTDDARAPTARNELAPCDCSRGRIHWVSLNNGYGVTQFYHGLPYPGGDRYLGGTQDNGTLRGADGRGPNAWTTIWGGDGGFVAVNPGDVNTIYVENTRTSIQKSTDGGESFVPRVNGIDDWGALFIAPFVMDPNNPEILWAGGSIIWRTINGAESWQAASGPVRGGSSVSAIAVAPGMSNRIMAGTITGFIHRTRRGLRSTGETLWPSTAPARGWVSSLAFDPANPDIAYATYSSFGVPHVWKTADGGATWVSIDGSGTSGLPDVPVLSIVIDPDNTSRLYIGTDIGVFVSGNGGQTWAQEINGFANVVVSSLAIDNHGGRKRLFAFTHGRGVWRTDL